MSAPAVPERSSGSANVAAHPGRQVQAPDRLERPAQALQGSGELGRATVPARSRVPTQDLAQQPDQLVAQIAEVVIGSELGPAHGLHDLERPLAIEGSAAEQALVQHDTERQHVGGRGRSASPVICSGAMYAYLPLRSRPQVWSSSAVALAMPKSLSLTSPVREHQHVVGAEVAVDQAQRAAARVGQRVHIGERGRELLGDEQGEARQGMRGPSESAAARSAPST